MKPHVEIAQLSWIKYCEVSMQIKHLIRAMSLAGMYFNYDRRPMVVYEKTQGRNVTGI